MEVDRTRSQKALKFHCQDGTGVESPRKEQKADPSLAGDDLCFRSWNTRLQGRSRRGTKFPSEMSKGIRTEHEKTYK